MLWCCGTLEPGAVALWSLLLGYSGARSSVTLVPDPLSLRCCGAVVLWSLVLGCCGARCSVAVVPGAMLLWCCCHQRTRPPDLLVGLSVLLPTIGRKRISLLCSLFVLLIRAYKVLFCRMYESDCAFCRRRHQLRHHQIYQSDCAFSCRP